MKELVTPTPSVDEEEFKVVASESLIVLPHIILIILGVCGLVVFPYFGFSTLISCVPVLHVVSHSISVCAYLSRPLHPRTYTSQPVLAGSNPNSLLA